MTPSQIATSSRKSRAQKGPPQSLETALPAKRKAGRRRAEEAPARDKLLAAASDLMHDKNGIDISFVEIGERTQLNPGLITYYFKSKEGLYRALLERDLRPGLKQFDALVNADISATAKLKHHISGVVNLYHRYPYTERLIDHVIGRADETEGAALYETYILPIVEGLSSIIEQGIRDGEIRSVDPLLLYYSISGAATKVFTAKYHRAYMHWPKAVPEEERRPILDHTLAFVLDGLLIRSGDGQEKPQAQVRLKAGTSE